MVAWSYGKSTEKVHSAFGQILVSKRSTDMVQRKEQTMIKSEQLLREAREQDHTCEFCYYEFFDDKAYPCSRCVCNQPTENMWRPKIKDEPQTERSSE